MSFEIITPWKTVNISIHLGVKLVNSPQQSVIRWWLNHGCFYFFGDTDQQTRPRRWVMHVFSEGEKMSNFHLTLSAQFVCVCAAQRHDASCDPVSCLIGMSDASLFHSTGRSDWPHSATRIFFSPHVISHLSLCILITPGSYKLI